MTYFAEIEVSGLVQRVIVADQSFINSAANSFNWIETKLDGSLKKRYAGVGMTYDSTQDIFVTEKPFMSWVLDSVKDEWNAPKPNPDKNKNYRWLENLQDWFLFPSVTGQLT